MKCTQLIALAAFVVGASTSVPANTAWSPTDSDHEALRDHTVVAAGTVLQFVDVRSGRSEEWFEFHGDDVVLCFEPVESPPIEFNGPHPALALVDSSGDPKIALFGGNIGRVSVALAPMRGMDCPGHR